jgi:hypothetical protein
VGCDRRHSLRHFKMRRRGAWRAISDTPLRGIAGPIARVRADAINLAPWLRPWSVNRPARTGPWLIRVGAGTFLMNPRLILARRYGNAARVGAGQGGCGCSALGRRRGRRAHAGRNGLRSTVVTSPSTLPASWFLLAICSIRARCRFAPVICFRVRSVGRRAVTASRRGLIATSDRPGRDLTFKIGVSHTAFLPA